jgi:hypothetical protein
MQNALLVISNLTWLDLTWLQGRVVIYITFSHPISIGREMFSLYGWSRHPTYFGWVRSGCLSSPHVSGYLGKCVLRFHLPFFWLRISLWKRRNPLLAASITAVSCSCILVSLMWGIGALHSTHPMDFNKRRENALNSYWQIGRSWVALTLFLNTKSVQRSPYELPLLATQVKYSINPIGWKGRSKGSENTSKPQCCHFWYLRWVFLHICHLCGVRRPVI